MREITNSDFYVISVPTPVDDANVPNMSALKTASEMIGKVLSPGDIVVFESTVYPGAPG